MTFGESRLDSNSYSKIAFHYKAFVDWTNLKKFPRFYFVVYKNGILIFESKVMEAVNFKVIEQYKKGKGEIIALGTYLIDASIPPLFYREIVNY